MPRLPLIHDVIFAVKIRYLPDFEFSWSDKTPQRSRDSITIEDSQDNSRVLKEQSMMGFLVEALMKKFVPEVSPIHPDEALV